jgi:hypothetical protein
VVSEEVKYAGEKSNGNGESDHTTMTERKVMKFMVKII